MAAKHTTNSPRRKTTRKQPLAIAAPDAASAPIASPQSAAPAGAIAIVPRNRKELAEAIVAPRTLVQVGRELLESTSEKGASVRLRAYEMLVDWQYGPQRPASSSSHAGLRIVWDIPRPAREAEESSE